MAAAVQASSFTDWAGLVIALGGLAVATGAFVYAGWQLRSSQRSARGTFLLNLEDMLRGHDKTHIRLDSDQGWEWAPHESEWPAVEAYMRVFGYIQLLLDEKILELETVERLYSFRVLNIVRNPHIREAKLVKKGQFWSDFCRLWKSLEGRGTWTENVAYLKRETEEDEVLDPEVRQRRLEDLAVTAACHVGRRA